MSLEVAEQLYLSVAEIAQLAQLTTTQVREALDHDPAILARYPSRPWGKADTIAFGVGLLILTALGIQYIRNQKPPSDDS